MSATRLVVLKFSGTNPSTAEQTSSLRMKRGIFLNASKPFIFRLFSQPDQAQFVSKNCTLHRRVVYVCLSFFQTSKTKHFSESPTAISMIAIQHLSACMVDSERRPIVGFVYDFMQLLLQPRSPSSLLIPSFYTLTQASRNLSAVISHERSFGYQSHRLSNFH